MLSCKEMFFATAHFAARSRTTTSAAIRNWKLRVDWVVIQIQICPRSPRALRSPADLLQHGAAAFTHRGIDGVLAHVDGIVPATFALLAVGLAYLDAVSAGPVS